MSSTKFNLLIVKGGARGVACMVQIMENYNIFKMFTVIAMLTTVFENSQYEFSKSVVTMATPVNISK